MAEKALLELSLPELREELAGKGLPKFRADQVYGWLLRGAGFDEMTNLPKSLREALAREYRVGGVRVERFLQSQKDGTVKFLFALEDGNLVEGVLMRHDYGNTLCISSQVGCRMGCAFCASTLEGKVRDLTAGEMLGEVIAASAHAAAHGLVRTREERPVTNVVMMGSGEPLDNYENTVRFLRMVRDEKGLGISLRNISLSTCGLAPALRRFTQEGLPVTLSLSLHAPEDALRSTIMPVAKAYPLSEVMDAVRAYEAKTSRRVVFEYALMAGVNDRPGHAAQLASLVRGLRCHVNLIPLNPVPECGIPGTPPAGIEAFRRALEERRVSVTVRRSMGEDIEGACGQLRRRVLHANP